MRDSPFPKRLKEARLKANISQKKLGIAAGMDAFVASSRMNHYEKGTHHPLFDSVSRIAEVLDTPTSYFYEVDDTLAELNLLVGTQEKVIQQSCLAVFKDKTSTNN